MAVKTWESHLNQKRLKQKAYQIDFIKLFKFNLNHALKLYVHNECNYS